MSESLKSAVRSAALRLLGPLVRLLLAAGIGVGEVASLVKMTYVREAMRQWQSGGGQGRPSVSRIGVVTGLTRAEVTSILSSGTADLPSNDRGRQRAERVLTGWWTDPDFLTSRGEPEVLPVRGACRSFAVLCRRYSGEMRSAPVLEELLRVGAVRRLPEGKLQALSRTCATVRWDPQGIEALGQQVGDLCETMESNLHHPTRPRFVRQVANTRLDPRYAPVLIRDIEESLKAKTDSLHETLNDPLHTAKRGAPAIRLGVGVYLFEDAVDPEPDPVGGVYPNPSVNPTARRVRRRKR